MTPSEKKVLDAAMRLHRHGLSLGWKQTDYRRGHPRWKLWQACAAHAKAIDGARKRKKR